MRKSDRIRILEIEIARLGAQVDVLSETLLALIDIRKIENESLDAGKWYNKNNH
jgi:hypothetical protein